MDITLSRSEIERSQLLRQKIKAQISQNGGWIPFSRYMETVLYAPEYGYYSADLPKFGPVGDFITAPYFRIWRW